MSVSFLTVSDLGGKGPNEVSLLCEDGGEVLVHFCK